MTPAMTEADWLACTCPRELLTLLPGKASDRKLRLFAVACCHRARHLLTETGEEVLNCAERFADGKTSPEEWKSADDISFWHGQGLHYNLEPDEVQAAFYAAFLAVRGDFLEAVNEASRSLGGSDGNTQCVIAQDIFGNLFRPVAFDPRWRTSDTVGLARAIYDDRAYERMQILADALMDADCEDEQIISHCRSEGPHVRGCWVVDLVLGKE